jgi:hypothetical protein
MKTVKKLLLITGTVGILLILFAGITLIASAVPSKSNREDTKAIKGKLNSISTCCPGGDIIFDLENDGGKSYYINRGVEHGLVVQDLERQLLGKEITLLYHKGGWNVLNYRNQVQHVCEVQIDKKVLYTELVD